MSKDKFSNKSTKILFFDGVCALCNGIVDFMILRDKNDHLKFAPLQGKTASENLDTKYLESLDTLVYLDNGTTYIKSEAVLRATFSLGGIFKLVLILKIIPSFLRDKIYDFVARNRYGWFGKKDACRLPSQEEKDKILL